MINAVPTAPGCVLATVIRVEVEAEDVPRIKAELGLDRDPTPEDLTTWSLGILERHFVTGGGTTKRIDAPDTQERSTLSPQTGIDDIDVNRMVRIGIHGRFMDQLMQEGIGTYCLVPGQLPDDTVIRGMSFDCLYNMFNIVVSSREFEPVPLGQVIPFKDLKLQRSLDRSPQDCSFMSHLMHFLFTVRDNVPQSMFQDLVIWPNQAMA